MPETDTSPAEPRSFSRSSLASAGSITVIWLPVSTMNSNGPALLIFTGITIRARATICGLSPATLPGQRVSAWLEMDVKVNAVATSAQKELESNGNFMLASARGCEPKATLAAISGYLNGLGVESMSMQYGKDVDRHNCW